MVMIDDVDTGDDAQEGEVRELAPHELRALQALDNADATLARPRPDPLAVSEWERSYAAAQARNRPAEPAGGIVRKRAAIDPPPAATPSVAYLTKREADARQAALERAVGLAMRRLRQEIAAEWQERVSALEARQAQLEGRLAVAESKGAKRK